jgi:hypothetical protein
MNTIGVHLAGTPTLARMLRAGPRTRAVQPAAVGIDGGIFNSDTRG